MIYGEGKYRYELVEDWGDIPSGWNVGAIAGVNTDEKDRIYVLTRTVPPVIVMDAAGKILESWGGDIFDRPHGVYLDRNGDMYCADDNAHCV